MIEIFNGVIIFIGFVASVLTLYAYFQPEKLPERLSVLESPPEVDSSYVLLAIRSYDEKTHDELGREIARLVQEFDASDFDRIQYMYNPSGFFKLILRTYRYARKLTAFVISSAVVSLMLALGLSFYNPSLSVSVAVFSAIFLALAIYQTHEAKKIFLSAKKIENYSKFLEANQITIQTRFFKKVKS